MEANRKKKKKEEKTPKYLNQETITLIGIKPKQKVQRQDELKGVIKIPVFLFVSSAICRPHLQVCSPNGHNAEGDGTPLQYSCLENPMDGGAWWATVPGVAASWT